MLQPSTYPEEHPSLSKLEHFRRDSKWLGTEENFYRAPLTTFFRRGRNNVGVPMQANHGSGHESTGLNDGSKNSVATTYLADSWNWGAEIFCGCEVKFVERDSNENGYIIHFAWHGSGRSMFTDHFKEQLFWVKAVGTDSIESSPCRIKTNMLISSGTERILFSRGWCLGHH